MKKVRRGSERRELAHEFVVTRKISISQACRVAGIDRKTYRYKPKKKHDNAVIENLLNTLPPLLHNHYSLPRYYS